jgi:predicted HicB family RNase H-like nuclease
MAKRLKVPPQHDPVPQGPTDRKTSLRIDPLVWKSARMIALENDMTVSDLIAAALREYVEHHTGRGGAR